MDKRSMFELTDEKLQKMTVPAVTTKPHQVQLKQALLAASYPTQTSIKTRWSNLMPKKKFVVSGLGLTLAAVAVVTFSVFSSFGQVSAAELTQQSLDKVTQLSPSQEQQLEMRVNADPKSALEAAEHAKNLSILTYAQFQQLLPQANTTAAHDPNDAGPGIDSLNPASLKYLKYIDASGATHIIGVDKNDLPVMIMVFSDSNGERSASVQITGTGPASTSPNSLTFNDTTAPSRSASGTQPDTTQCSSNNGNTTCSSSGGSSPNCQTLSNGMVTCSQSGSSESAHP